MLHWLEFNSPIPGDSTEYLSTSRKEWLTKITTNMVKVIPADAWAT